MEEMLKLCHRLGKIQRALENVANRHQYALKKQPGRSSDYEYTWGHLLELQNQTSAEIARQLGYLKEKI